MAARARETAAGFRHEADASPAEEKKQRCREAVREIATLTDDVGEQVRLYKQRTGKSRSDFFRRKREVESGEFDPEARGG